MSNVAMTVSGVAGSLGNAMGLASTEVEGSLAAHWRRIASVALILCV